MVTSVIVKICVSVCFLTLYILQAWPPIVARPGIAPLTLLFEGTGCVINALINALKKLTQCTNALQKLTL